MMRTALLLIAGLAATPVAVQDIDGHRLSLLSPPEHQLELLFFISSDCPISNRYAPEIQRVCNDYQSRGVRCVAVYPDAPDAATVKRHGEAQCEDCAEADPFFSVRKHQGNCPFAANR